MIENQFLKNVDIAENVQLIFEAAMEKLADQCKYLSSSHSMKQKKLYNSILITFPRDIIEKYIFRLMTSGQSSILWLMMLTDLNGGKIEYPLNMIGKVENQTKWWIEKLAGKWGSNNNG